jgi:hypothetical protein
MAPLVNPTVKYCNSEALKNQPRMAFLINPTVKYCNSKTHKKSTTNGFSD